MAAVMLRDNLSLDVEINLRIGKAATMLGRLSPCPTSIQTPRRKIFLWKKADVEGMRQDVKEFANTYQYPDPSTPNALEQMWSDIKQMLSETVEKRVPSKTSAARHTSPWITTSIRRAICRKQRAHKKARMTGKKKDVDRYRRIQAQTRYEIRQASRKYLEDVDGLEERKSQIRSMHPKRKAIMTAIKRFDLEKVDRLLMQGVDPNFRDASGNFPLHLACSFNPNDFSASLAVPIVERLVYMGADLEVGDRFSRLPLHVAAATSHHFVSTLLDKGCSINAQDNAGCTALMEACSNNKTDPLKTVTLLLKHSANVHLIDHQGFTALHYICKNWTHDESVRNDLAILLLQTGLSATACDCEGKMALCYELDRLQYTTNQKLPFLKTDVMETLIVAGSNLHHNSKAHQYWVRFALTTIRPKVLLMVLQLFSALITRPSLLMISKIMTDRKTEGHDKDDEQEVLQTEVTRLTHSVDSLQSICRSSINTQLRGKVLVGAPQLPLPNMLKNFLLSRSHKPLLGPPR
ncbi:hypothetical protein ACOMHN_021947 [Nucella lapillus]